MPAIAIRSYVVASGGAAADEPPRPIAAGGVSVVLVFCWVLATVGCASHENERSTVLRCDYGSGLQDVYELNENAQSVRLLTVDPPRPGSLGVSDAVYRLEFRENEPAAGYLLLKVNINRFTAKAEREIGREQQVMHEGQLLNLHVVKDSGQCVRVDDDDTL